jgi:hypothetical protein
MKVLRIVFFLVLVSFTYSTFAQTNASESQSEKEKKQKELEKLVFELLDQSVSEASNLKLPQNRALVYCVAGDLFWKTDEKHARKLFQDAANDLIVTNQQAEKDKKDSDDPYFGLWEWGSVREDVLPLVAKHDADLAIELLIQTRSAALIAGIAKASQPTSKQSGGMFNFDPQANRVRNEIALEQRFAVLSAEQNPDKAIKLIKDSLSRGISWNVLPLLQKLNRKNEKKATELATDIAKQISDTDLTKKREDLSAAVRFLQYAENSNTKKDSKEKRFKFTDSQISEIANKVAETYLKPSNSLDLSIGFSQALPLLEKLLPEKSALLKQRQTELMKTIPPEIKKMQERQKLWNSATTPEEILEKINEFDESEKATAYSSLLNKIGKIEDEARAKKLIDKIPDEKFRDRATDAFESARITRTVKEGKLDEAKSLIGKIGKKSVQIEKLVSIAIDFHKKGTEKDVETAANLMKDVKALINENPEDEDELNSVMEAVTGYATTNPTEAFRLFGPFVDQLNDFVQASAVLSKYNKESETFKKGELILKVDGYSWNTLLLFRYIKQFQLLGKADLLKMTSLSDRFTRTDARIAVKLFIAQGFLRDPKKDEEEKLDEEENEFFY